MAVLIDLSTSVMGVLFEFHFCVEEFGKNARKRNLACKPLCDGILLEMS